MVSHRLPEYLDLEVQNVARDKNVGCYTELKWQMVGDSKDCKVCNRRIWSLHT